MLKKRVYLDHNATTPLHPEVKKAMTQMMEIFGNPSSIHNFGRDAKQMMEVSRTSIAEFINASPEEIIFVGSGSEANNTVLNLTACCSSLECSIAYKHGKGLLTSRIEHPCILESSKCLEERGMKIDYLEVDSRGKINMEQLKAKLSNHPILVSIMSANNEIGTIQDIPEIVKLVHDNGVLFHTDAVQSIGKISVDVKKLEVDFLSFSAHKIYGPKGVGALYVKKGVPFCPFIRGGHQEQGRRAGTENTLGIVGMAKAIEMRKLEMADENKRLLGLKTRLKDGLIKNIADIKVNGHPNDCLVSTLNISFSGVEGESILLYLDLEGIAVSTGSACSSGSLDPSHVILAIGATPELAHGSIRFSLGRSTTAEEIDYVIEKTTAIIKKLRAMSTVYIK